MLLRPLLVLRTSSASFIVAADRQYFGYLALVFQGLQHYRSGTTLNLQLEVESYVKLYFRCRLYSCTNEEVNFPTGNRRRTRPGRRPGASIRAQSVTGLVGTLTST